ncbi:unnamed protein product [Pelagomonas calceolata]|uniref:Uncharacterized protein n=1 Tax=Pelagomonas calceolata TaxID=35677 RepID=A0A8J2T0R2_9STRA|nr:unnamed protein product [Pelagomonas calceolata]
MRLLAAAALLSTTCSRLYTPRLFPPRPEPPLPPLTKEACDRQARDERRARQYSNTTCAPLVDGGCATSCCRTGAEEDTARARRWVAARSYIVASLATSDPACAARATVENLLAHTTDVLVVVHRGCGSERFTLSDARVVLNPVCVPTRRAYGSLLHAHLRNVLYAKTTFSKPPTHVLLTAANLYWIAPGVESYIRAVGSSVYGAPRVAPPATHPPDLDPDWASIVRRLPSEGALQQKHEGSFYPWAAAAHMVHTIDLNRLNHRSCFCGGFCIEEYYLPNLFYLLEKDRFPSGIDAACYARANPDLRPGYCVDGECDARGLRRHWDDFGRCEGRPVACPPTTMESPTLKARVTVFYNVFAKATGAAAAIVAEQMSQLREAPLWPFIEEVRYATIGPDAAVAAEVAKHCTDVTCVHLGHDAAGSELNSLEPLHAYCVQNPEASVAYLHDKGSFHESPRNARLRRVLLRGLASRPCAAAITAPSACDVCSSRFAVTPHQHTSGNMWLARCSYVQRLHAPRDFRRRMELHYGRKKGGEAWPLGTWRFAYEHWVHSHPSLRACDVLDHEFQEGYGNLPPTDFEISFALAPRYNRGHAFFAAATAFRGRPAAFSLDDRIPEMEREWRALYNATPPPLSRLRTYYGGRACVAPAPAAGGGRRDDFLFAGTVASRDRVLRREVGRTKFAVKHRAHNVSCARSGIS